MARIRVYLAGPEVFLKNAVEIGNQKKVLCHKHGFEGIFPLDSEIDLGKKTPKEVAFTISEVNEGLIKSCQVVIANITPFRGPSADVGTVFEIGFAHALGKLVLAYTNIAASFTERTVAALNNRANRGEGGKLWDAESMFIEEHGLTDNLMIDGCINVSSKTLVIQQAPKAQLFTYLVGFDRCLQAAKELIKVKL